MIKLLGRRHPRRQGFRHAQGSSCGYLTPNSRLSGVLAADVNIINHTGITIAINLRFSPYWLLPAPASPPAPHPATVFPVSERRPGKSPRALAVLPVVVSFGHPQMVTARSVARVRSTRASWRLPVQQLPPSTSLGDAAIAAAVRSSGSSSGVGNAGSGRCIGRGCCGLGRDCCRIACTFLVFSGIARQLRQLPGWPCGLALPRLVPLSPDRSGFVIRNPRQAVVSKKTERDVRGMDRSITGNDAKEACSNVFASLYQTGLSGPGREEETSGQSHDVMGTCGHVQSISAGHIRET